MKQELDWTNLQIVKYLKAHPKQTTSDITKAVDLRSNLATANRLRYLEYIGLVRREHISEIEGTNGTRSNHTYWYVATTY